MRQSKSLVKVSRSALLVGMMGVTLAACSGGGGSADEGPFATPSPVPAPTPTPTPTPSPPPPPPPVPASQAASQLGAGFNMAFTEPPFGTPYDPDQNDVAELTATVNPIDIENP